MSLRLGALREKMNELGLDALIVSRNEDQQYLTGFSGHADFDSVLLISQTDARIVTDFRYVEAATRQAPALPVMKLERGKYEIGDALRDFAQANHLRIVGFEPQHVNVFRYKQWQKTARKAGVKLKAAEDVILQLRAVKDESEIGRIRRAVDLTDAAFAHFVSVVHPGMTEKQGAWIIESYFREHGAEGNAFDPIVASGPNAALPHAVPSDRQIQLGEPLTIDIGARMDGYNADMTRTIILGHTTAKFDEIYNIVLKAQLAVEKRARVGMKGKQIDRIARRIIEQAGYGENFGHGLGHGVGRVVHELPRGGKSSQDIVKAGMLLTIEPGIYIPDWGGVRIEDLVVFRDDGVEVLTRSTKDPLARAA